MSQPVGRSGKRGGRGQRPKKSSSTTEVPGRPGTSTSQQEKRVDQPGASQEKSTEKVQELTTRTQLLKIGDRGGKGDGPEGDNGGNGAEGASIGRGGVRGRRRISTVNILKTKPTTCTSKIGDVGTRIELMTNYFKIETIADWILFHYRVDFNVQEDRESVLRALLNVHKTRLRTAFIFDGASLFTSQRLTPNNEPLELTSIRDSDKAPVTITIKLVQELNYGNAVYLQVFNILVRRCLLHLNLQLVNRNYFDPKASIQLPQHNLEIWPGYVTAIRQHEHNILMCSEVTHKVMRTDTALKLLSECAKESSDYRRLFQQAVIGAIVLTDYNNKTYRIDDVDFNSNPTCTFKYKNEQITYVDYYKQKYQLQIRDLRQPLLVSRASAKDLRAGLDKQCLLVPELCRMTGLSNKMLENRFLMQDLSNITRVSPENRIKRIKGFMARLQGEPRIAEDFKQWGLKISEDLVTVTGRELPQEQLIAGRTVTYYSGSDVDWTRNMRKNPMLHCGRFDSFVVICPNKIKREMEEFLQVLKKSADGMQFRMPRPYVIDTRTDGPADLLEAVEMAMGKFHPDLILFGVTTDRADRYSAIKKKCFVDRGIQSQVVISRTMKSKSIMSIATKVAVQINCKIGGAPWSVHIPTENIMVVGFDVCHDAYTKSKSVGVVVASLNKAMSAWYSTVSFHSSGEELSDSLSLDICKAIRKYREVNSNHLPTRIVIYRDGVGEGQINHVYNHEVVVLKKRLTELYGNENWKLAYILVTKRISTRFFYKGQNPRPGTIVDDVVTLPENYDFLLVSQTVRMGTVTPTNYNVISDNLGWNPNHVQRFTYKMTHLYYNCSATVRVPAPCQYAHKLAFMVSQNLHAQPHPNLETSLYFL